MAVNKAFAFSLGVLCSLGLYLAVFRVLERPLTMGEINVALERKFERARNLQSTKLAIWAGSNGRYSHRCAAFADITKLPCVNLSLAFGIGIDFQLRQVETLLHPGDVLYMPLEFSQYQVNREQMESGVENMILVHHRRDVLWTLEPRRIARALGAFDLKYLVDGIIETVLASRGLRRLSPYDQLTVEGDESGHTALRGAPNQPALARMVFDRRLLPRSSYALQVLANFLDRAHRNGVRVYAGLPTTPDNAKLDAAGLVFLQQFYSEHHAAWIMLPNRSQYPISCFYDTLYHLNEECQVDHSRKVGALLSDALRARP